MSASRTARSALTCTALALAGLPAGCTPGSRGADGRIAAAARPILELDAQAVWTDCYNRLLEFGPASVAYLAEHPVVAGDSAGDLELLVHLSLLRLLVHPSQRPELSAMALETTLDLLHFDPHVRGRRLGPICFVPDVPIHSWTELYPAEFDSVVAAQVTLDADRRLVREWWRTRKADPAGLVLAEPLKPSAADAWSVLGRRYADRWIYNPHQPRAVRCGPFDRTPLLALTTADYNLVRAACAWLGSSPDTAVRDRLIEAVASPSPIVSHNARLALRYAADARIRDMLDRYNHPQSRAAPPQRSRAEL